MSFDTFVVYTGQYDTEEDALADYDAVRQLYVEAGVINTYDAAVVTKDADGR